MTSTSFVFTELANTIKYGGGFLYNLVFNEWRHCVSQNEVCGRGCYITLFSPSDVTAFHRVNWSILNTYACLYLYLIMYIVVLTAPSGRTRAVHWHVTSHSCRLLAICSFLYDVIPDIARHCLMYSQQTWHVAPSLVYCWANVVDSVQTVNQRWASVSCLLVLGVQLAVKNYSHHQLKLLRSSSLKI